MTNKGCLRLNWPSEPMRHQISVECPELSVRTHLIRSVSGCRSPTYLFVCLFLAGNKAQMRDGACNSSQHCSQHNSSKWWIYLGISCICRCRMCALAVRSLCTAECVHRRVWVCAPASAEIKCHHFSTSGGRYRILFVFASVWNLSSVLSPVSVWPTRQLKYK